MLCNAGAALWMSSKILLAGYCCLPQQEVKGRWGSTQWQWRAGGNFVTFASFFCTTKFIIDWAAPFLSMCELVTLWLGCHSSIPAKRQPCAPFWRAVSGAFLVGQHEPLGKYKACTVKYLRNTWDKSVHLKCVYTCISSLPKQHIFRVT